MSETPTKADLSRIDAALARIERAAAARTAATEQLARRHATLRDGLAEAVTALDSLIARQAEAEGRD
ncbi:hypothetical protein ACNI3Q_01445 [Sphingomonas sp. FW199]|uniref:hypothetical protein n=1 Tax=unclassified Sphingomonas TaxID=196159 RepID=UPI0021A3FB57|nr:hypothetical protein [Sphingomonas sp. BGYR3]MDG5487535.1 hypothetical protein [Sphingomonas sp. BGYR3]